MDHGPSTALGTAPRVKRYPVAAIFEIGMHEYDSSIMFMPLNETQKYFNQPGTVTVLEVVLDSPDEVGDLGPKIAAAGGPSIYITDWRQRNATFFNALEVERNVMFLILALIVLVAALNIISGLIMLVKDKGRDIAILRTMGATRGAAPCCTAFSTRVCSANDGTRSGSSSVGSSASTTRRSPKRICSTAR